MSVHCRKNRNMCKRDTPGIKQCVLLIRIYGLFAVTLWPARENTGSGWKGPEIVYLTVLSHSLVAHKWIYHICLSIQLLIDIWIFPSLGAIMNKAAINIQVWMFVWT